MLYNKIFLLTLSLMFLSSGACVNLKQPSYSVSHYTLEYEMPGFEEMPSLDAAVKIERFTVSPLYNSLNIVYRENEYSRDAYAYHKWRINPGDMVTELLTRDMMESRLFRAVLPSGGISEGAHYILRGNVDGFYEESGDRNWYGVISLTVVMINQRERDPGRKIVFQKSYQRKKRCDKKNPQALAKALSEGMREISKEIIEDVYSKIKGE